MLSKSSELARKHERISIVPLVLASREWIENSARFPLKFSVPTADVGRMQNRRNDYRHHFPEPSGMHAHLISHEARGFSVSGEVLDLSVGGTALQISARAAPLVAGTSCDVRFSLPGNQTFSATARIVHGDTALARRVGVQFLPLVDLDAQERRERTIWQFLLQEQRKIRNRGA